MIMLLELPWRESLSSIVSFESQNGIYLSLYVLSDSKDITLPRFIKDLLMFFVSYIIYTLDNVSLSLSEPAKSINYI